MPVTNQENGTDCSRQHHTLKPPYKRYPGTILQTLAGTMSSGEPSRSPNFTRGGLNRIYDSAKIKKEDMNELVMNFLVKKEHASAAEKFYEETGTLPKEFPKRKQFVCVVRAILSHNIEDAFKVVKASHPEMLIPNARLFINLGQLRWLELIREGNEEAASGFYEDHLKQLIQSSPSFGEEWVAFVQMSTEGSLGSPIRSILEDESHVKMVIEEFEWIMAEYDPDDKRVEPRAPRTEKHRPT